ncbi:MAG TPA: hypothetical protein VFL79_20755, partial [Terriglobia bacterium]|nr:hypothetical protein [Terriglobia bacterium]
MKFWTAVARMAFFMFALAAVAGAQAPAQTSAQTAAPPGADPNSLLAAATAGDAQAQFKLGEYYFSARYVTL